MKADANHLHARLAARRPRLLLLHTPSEVKKTTVKIYAGLFLKQDDLLVNTGSVTGAKIKISSSRIKDIINERCVN